MEILGSQCKSLLPTPLHPRSLTKKSPCSRQLTLDLSTKYVSNPNQTKPRAASAITQIQVGKKKEMSSVYLRIHILSFLSLFSTLAYLPEWKMSRCFSANHFKPVGDDFWGWKGLKQSEEDCSAAADTGGHTWSAPALCWTLVTFLTLPQLFLITLPANTSLRLSLLQRSAAFYATCTVVLGLESPV